MRELNDYRYMTVRKVLNYARISRDIRKRKTRINGYPSHIFIEPTNICNTDCQLCPVGRGVVSDFPKGKLTLENAKRIIDKSKGVVFSIGFWLWGEPLLNKDLFKMIGYAHESKIKTGLSTNLHAFRNNMVESLFASGLDRISISCHGVTQETYEKYQPNKDFDVLRRKIDYITETKEKLGYRKPTIHLVFTITKKNQHEVEQMRAFSEKYGVEADIFYASLNLRFDKNMDESRKRIEEWGPDVLEGIGGPEKKKCYDFVQTHNRLPIDYEYCKEPFETMYIGWNGDVSACCEDYHRYVLGNALDQDLKQIWNNEKYREIREFVSTGGKTGTGKNALCRNCFRF